MGQIDYFLTDIHQNPTFFSKLCYPKVQFYAYAFETYELENNLYYLFQFHIHFNFHFLQQISALFDLF